jgi:general secretion pathway protein I
MAGETTTGREVPTSDRRKERGFTLLEVVVAATIAAFALIGLFRSSSIGLLAVDQSSRVEEAIERAQSHLAAFGKSETIVLGDRQGDDGGGYRWRLSATPIDVQNGQADPENSPELALFDVKVTISWRAGGRERSVALDTRRIGVASIGSK